MTRSPLLVVILVARAERFTHAIHGAGGRARNHITVRIVRQQRDVIEGIRLFVQVPARVVVIARPVIQRIRHPGALPVQRVIAKRCDVIQRIFRRGQIAAVVIRVRRDIPFGIRNGERLSSRVVGVGDRIVERVA